MRKQREQLQSGVVKNNNRKILTGACLIAISSILSSCKNDNEERKFLEEMNENIDESVYKGGNKRYKESIDIFYETKDELAEGKKRGYKTNDLEGEVERFIGKILYEQGNQEEAADHIEEAIQLFTDKTKKAYTKQDLGSCYIDLAEKENEEGANPASINTLKKKASEEYREAQELLNDTIEKLQDKIRHAEEKGEHKSARELDSVKKSIEREKIGMVLEAANIEINKEPPYNEGAKRMINLVRVYLQTQQEIKEEMFYPYHLVLWYKINAQIAANEKGIMREIYIDEGLNTANKIIGTKLQDIVLYRVRIQKIDLLEEKIKFLSEQGKYKEAFTIQKEKEKNEKELKIIKDKNATIEREKKYETKAIEKDLENARKQTAAVIFALLGASIWLVQHRRRNKKMRKQNEKLTMANITITEQNEEIEATNEQLTATNDGLQAANEQLIQLNTTITEQNEVIEATNKELEKERNETKKLYDEISIVYEERGELNEKLRLMNEELKASNEAIEKAKKDIEDGEKCARSIQKGLYPKDKEIKKYFQDGYFIYDVPQSILSGDFYRYKETKKDIFFALLDGTGHGPTPALLHSLIKTNLDETIDRFKKTEKENNTNNSLEEEEKEQILKIVIGKLNSELAKIESDNNQNCASITICQLNKETNKLKYIRTKGIEQIYIRKKDEELPKEDIKKILDEKKQILYKEGKIKTEEEITEEENIILQKTEKILGSKGSLIELEEKIDAPLGDIDQEVFKKIEIQEIQLSVGDRIYLMSDGVPDQFGGDTLKGKKLLRKRIREILIEVNKGKLPMKAQENFLKRKLRERQKEHHKSTDDKTVIAFEVQAAQIKKKNEEKSDDTYTPTS